VSCPYSGNSPELKISITGLGKLPQLVCLARDAFSLGSAHFGP
jgi:hypothetical protein